MKTKDIDSCGLLPRQKHSEGLQTTGSLKSSLRKLLLALAFGGLMLPRLAAGNEILLYPLALALGEPRESELVKCRLAFQRLQAHLKTSGVVVEPVLFVDGHRRAWRQDLAEAICREAAARQSAELEVAVAAPAVPAAQFRRNQLRYLWERAAQYSKWVKAAHPAGDYLVFAEIWGHDGTVGGIQIYIIDPSGQVAFCRLANSHHFGGNLPLEGDKAVRLIVNYLFDGIKMDAKQVFPPYGIG